MTDLLQRLKKNSRLEATEVLSRSKIFLEKESIPTDVPMLNVALSGDLNGGISRGVTVLAGPSKHFKTSFALKMASAYLSARPESVLLFYDSEFGSPQQYFTTYDIDIDRVIHTPIMNVEELKFDLAHQLESLQAGDDVIILIDSIGNLASKKEVEDALSEKSVADMSRAKQLKSLFRMITPYLTMKNIPLLAINHTYKTMEMYSKDVVSGGTGIYYSADNIWIIGRQQNKEGTELEGYHFVINIEKSRFLKEKSKIPITVNFDSGIEQYSGLLELAIAGGFVAKASARLWQRIDPETGEFEGDTYSRKDLYDPNLWKPILDDQRFHEYIRAHFQLGYKSPLGDDFDITTVDIDEGE